MNAWIKSHRYVIAIPFGLLGWWLAEKVNPLIVVVGGLLFVAVYSAIVRSRRGGSAS